MNEDKWWQQGILNGMTAISLIGFYMVFYFSREGFYASFSFENPFFVKLSSTTPVMIKILYSVLRGLG